MRVRTSCDYVSESEFTDCWPKVLFLTNKKSLPFSTVLFMVHYSLSHSSVVVQMLFGGLSYFICD